MKLLSEVMRPTEIDDLVQPDDVVMLLKRMVERKQPMNLILWGPPGTGKTSTVRIICKKLDLDVIKLKGSRSTGIDVVRDHIEPFAQSTSLFEKQKAVFIDEAEFASKATQASLRSLTEDFPELRLFLATNDLEKIDEALRSRCLSVPFDIPIHQAKSIADRVIPRYHQRLATNGVELSVAKLREAFLDSFPDMRTLANLVQRETLLSD